MSKDPFDFAGVPVVPKSKTNPVQQETKPVTLLTERLDGFSQAPNFTILPTPTLTWKQSGIYGEVKQVRINSKIDQLMKEDVSFANYIRTVITCHIVNNPLDDKSYSLPDQFRDEYGIDVVTVESFSKDALDMPVVNGRRPQPELKECTIHVLL